jgi:hypothetical protein
MVDGKLTPRALPVHLTEEEALALLDLCLVTEKEDNAARIRAMRKLGDLCRDYDRARRESDPADALGQRVECTVHTYYR